MATGSWSSWTKSSTGQRYQLSADVLSRSGDKVVVRITGTLQNQGGTFGSNGSTLSFAGSSSGSFVWVRNDGKVWSSGTYSQTQDITLTVGYGSGTLSFWGTGVTTVSWCAGTVSVPTVSVSYGSTYIAPQRPAISSFTSSNGYSEAATVNTYATASAAISSVVSSRAYMTEEGVQAFVNTTVASGNNSSVSWTVAEEKTGAAVTWRAGAQSIAAGWQYSDYALILQAPTDPTGFSVVANTTFGATFSWTNTHDKSDYYTNIYEGSISLGIDGRPVTTGATLLASLEPGVSSWSKTDLWSTTGGLVEKTFSLVQVSALEPWANPVKSTYSSSGLILEGYGSSVMGASLSNGALPPLAAYDVSLTSYDDSGFTIKFSTHAPTQDRPRTGFRVYAAGVVVGTITDISGASTGNERTYAFASSIKGVAANITIQAYGSGGTANTPNLVAYGTLYAPAVPSGSRRANNMTLAATKNVSNTYSNELVIEYSTDNETWLKYTGALTAQYVSYYARAYVSSSLSGRRSDYSPILTLSSPPMAFTSFTAEQVNSYEEADNTKCVLRWSLPVTPQSKPTSFRVVNNKNSTSWTIPAIEGQSEYEYPVDWLLPEATTFTLTAYNEWENVGVTTEYLYTPPRLGAPVLLTLQPSAEDSSKVILAFSPSFDGAPWTDDGNYYKYRIYVNGTAVTDWLEGKPQYGSVVFLQTALSAHESAFRVGAIDSQGRTSDLSNTMYYYYKAQDTGVYLYKCNDFVIEDCIIMGKNALRLEESSVTLTNTEIIYDNQPYIMSDGSKFKEIGCQVNAR